jgi:hypothetical protein
MRNLLVHFGLRSRPRRRDTARRVLLPAVALSCLAAVTAAAEDSFNCYKGKTAKGEVAAPGASLQLTDAIEDKLTTVTKRTSVCNRSNVGSEPVIDSVANWTCYGIKQDKSEPKFVRSTVYVRDRFGQHSYSLVKPTQMCVISERDSAGVPAPIDELKCYKVAPSEGVALSTPFTITLTDQLGGTRNVVVKKPTMMCGPVSRDGRSTIDPSENWMCYQIADEKTVPAQPKFPGADVTVSNLFEGPDPRAMRLTKPWEACFPQIPHPHRAAAPGFHFCDANDECSTGEYCDLTGVCEPEGAGEAGDPCGSGGDCDEDLYCDLRGIPGTCRTAGAASAGAPCATTGECEAGLVCSASGSCDTPRSAFPDFPGVSCATDESSFGAYFEVPRPGLPPADFYRLPFPNDARIAADGTLNLADFPRPGPSILGVDIVDLYADSLSEDFQGFGTNPSVIVRFSKELDFDSSTSSHVHLVDVTPASPELGNEHDFTLSYQPGRGLYRCQNYLALRPSSGDALISGHTYAVLIDNGIRSTHDEAPLQDPDLTALLASAPPADADLAEAWARYDAVRDYLASVPILGSSLAVVVQFTLQDTTEDLVSIAAAAQAAPPPVLSDLTLCDGVAVSPCDDGTSARSCGSVSPDYYEIHGRIGIPVYQQGAIPYENEGDGGIAFDAVGAPIQQGTAEVCFALTVPKSTPPAGGWPLVVHAHGTGGNFRSGITGGIAPVLSVASPPMATLTFDGIAHGERRGASTRTPDSLVFNVVNPRAARDNHLQGAVDVIYALRVAQTAPVVGPVSVTFDAARTYYFGHSQGSNVGIVALAATDLAHSTVLSGAGGLLIEGLLSKTSPVNVSDALSFVVGERAVAGQPVMELLAEVVSRADPISYAPLVLRRPPPGVSSKHVLMTWGAGDTWSPTPQLAELAAAAGLPVAAPVLEDIGTGTVARPVANNVSNPDGTSSTAAVVQYAPGVGHDGNEVALTNASAIADWTAFLSSAALTGTPAVP